MLSKNKSPRFWESGVNAACLPHLWESGVHGAREKTDYTENRLHRKQITQRTDYTENRSHSCRVPRGQAVRAGGTEGLLCHGHSALTRTQSSAMDTGLCQVWHSQVWLCQVWLCREWHSQVWLSQVWLSQVCFCHVHPAPQWARCGPAHRDSPRGDWHGKSSCLRGEFMSTS